MTNDQAPMTNGGFSAYWSLRFGHWSFALFRNRVPFGRLASHHLVLALLGHIAREALIFLRHLLNVVFRLIPLVLRKIAIFFALLGGLIAVAADIADADLGLLGQLLDPSDQLFAVLRSQRRHVDADHAAVVLRRQ